MIIKALHLENIRSYESLHLEFPEGNILFEGDIGCGKSTLLMCVEFALFGFGDQKADSLLRMNTNKGKVVLDAEIDGQHVIITRVIEKKKKSITQGELTIEIDDQIQHVSATELKAIVLKLLKFNEPINPKARSVIYRYAIFTPQEEMKAILWEKTSDRLNILRKAMQLEDYKIADQNAHNILKTLEDFKKRKAQREAEQVVKNQELMTNQMKQRESDKTIKELQTKRINIDSNVKILEAEQKKANENYRRLSVIESNLKHAQQQEKQNLTKQREIQDQIELKNKEISQHQFLKKRLEAELADMGERNAPTTIPKPKLESHLRIVRKLEKQVADVKSKEKQSEQSINQLKQKIGNYTDYSSEELQKRISELKSKLAQTEQDEENLREKASSAKTMIDTAQAMIDNLKKELARLEALPGQCPTCKQSITGDIKENLVNNQRNQITEFNHKRDFQLKRYSELKVHLEDTVKTRQNINLQINDLNVIKANVDAIQQTKKQKEEYHEQSISVEKEIAELMRGFDEWHASKSGSEVIEHLLKAINDFELFLSNRSTLLEKIKNENALINININQIEELTQQLNKLREELPQIRANIEAYSTQLQDLNAAKALLYEIEGKLTEAKTTLNKLIEELAQANAILVTEKQKEEEIKDELKQLEEQLQRIKKAADYHIWLANFFIPTLPIIEAQVMAKIQNEFNEKFQEWFAILVPDPTKNARIDESFNPIIEQDGYEQQLDYLSGGEKTSVALAYRLALNFTIQQLATGMTSDFIIFDEPTDGFSKEQLGKFRDLLGHLPCRQVILVSHERELENLADQIFWVEKQNGVSKIRVR